jgi:hypothetical protein
VHSCRVQASAGVISLSSTDWLSLCPAGLRRLRRGVVIMSLWGGGIDGHRPVSYDWLGAASVAIGVAVFFFGPARLILAAITGRKRGRLLMAAVVPGALSGLPAECVVMVGAVRRGCISPA